MTLRCFLFDLDMTLVDSEALRAFRDSGNWSEVRRNMSLLRLFPSRQLHPHQLPGYLHKQGYKVGIVTSAPKWYADVIIEKFGIYNDLLISYSDTKLHKPDPEPLIKALDIFKTEPEYACYLGDTADDMVASFRAGVFPVGADWGIRERSDLSAHAPGLIVSSPERFVNIEDWPNYGYIMEVASGGIQPSIHLNSAIRWDDGKMDCFSLGRYYAQSDVRHANSGLSRNIIDLKNNNGNNALFADAIETFINQYLTRLGRKPAFVTYVPAWEGKVDRFANIFDILTRENGQGIQFIKNGLKTKRKIVDYKVKSAYEREKTLEDAFTTNLKWKGRILLIDDVYTSGATTRTCAKALLASGADEVMTCTFGRDQDHSILQSRKCPECGMDLVVRVNRRQNSGRLGKRFWACKGWKPGGTGCNFTEPIDL